MKFLNYSTLSAAQVACREKNKAEAPRHFVFAQGVIFGALRNDPKATPPNKYVVIEEALLDQFVRSATEKHENMLYEVQEAFKPFYALNLDLDAAISSEVNTHMVNWSDADRADLLLAVMNGVFEVAKQPPFSATSYHAMVLDSMTPSKFSAHVYMWLYRDGKLLWSKMMAPFGYLAAQILEAYLRGRTEPESVWARMDVKATRNLEHGARTVFVQTCLIDGANPKKNGNMRLAFNCKNPHKPVLAPLSDKAEWAVLRQLEPPGHRDYSPVLCGRVHWRPLWQPKDAFIEVLLNSPVPVINLKPLLGNQWLPIKDTRRLCTDSTPELEAQRSLIDLYPIPAPELPLPIFDRRWGTTAYWEEPHRDADNPRIGEQKYKFLHDLWLVLGKLRVKGRWTAEERPSLAYGCSRAGTDGYVGFKVPEKHFDLVHRTMVRFYKETNRGMLFHDVAADISILAIDLDNVPLEHVASYTRAVAGAVAEVIQRTAPVAVTKCKGSKEEIGSEFVSIHMYFYDLPLGKIHRLAFTKEVRDKLMKVAAELTSACFDAGGGLGQLRKVYSDKAGAGRVHLPDPLLSADECSEWDEFEWLTRTCIARSCAPNPEDNYSPSVEYVHAARRSLLDPSESDDLIRRFIEWRYGTDLPYQRVHGDKIYLACSADKVCECGDTHTSNRTLLTLTRKDNGSIIACHRCLARDVPVYFIETANGWAYQERRHPSRPPPNQPETMRAFLRDLSNTADDRSGDDDRSGGDTRLAQFPDFFVPDHQFKQWVVRDVFGLLNVAYDKLVDSADYRTPGTYFISVPSSRSFDESFDESAITVREVSVGETPKCKLGHEIRDGHHDHGPVNITFKTVEFSMGRVTTKCGLRHTPEDKAKAKPSVTYLAHPDQLFSGVRVFEQSHLQALADNRLVDPRPIPACVAHYLDQNGIKRIGGTYLDAQNTLWTRTDGCPEHPNCSGIYAETLLGEIYVRCHEIGSRVQLIYSRYISWVGSTSARLSRYNNGGYGEITAIPLPPIKTILPAGQIGTTVTALRAMMSVGKTESLAEFIAGVLYEFPHTSFLVLTYRRSLAKELSEKFGLNCYLNSQGKVEVNERTMLRLVIQLDSVVLLQPDADSDQSTYNYVFLDEVTSLCAHISSATLVGKHEATVKCVLRYIKTADHVLAMDAQLDERALALLTAGHEKRLNVFSDTLARKQKDVVIKHDKEFFCKTMMSAARKAATGAHPFAIVDSSKDMCVALHDFLIKLDGMPPETVGAIYAESADRNTLQNPNVNWVKFNALIYNSSVDAGVSFTINHFDRLFVRPNPQIATPRSTLQQQARIRSLSSNSILSYVPNEHFQEKNLPAYTSKNPNILEKRVDNWTMLTRLPPTGADRSFPERVSFLRGNPNRNANYINVAGTSLESIMRVLLINHAERARSLAHFGAYYRMDCVREGYQVFSLAAYEARHMPPVQPVATDNEEDFGALRDLLFKKSDVASRHAAEARTLTRFAVDDYSSRRNALPSVELHASLQATVPAFYFRMQADTELIPVALQNPPVLQVARLSHAMQGGTPMDVIDAVLGVEKMAHIDLLALYQMAKEAVNELLQRDGATKIELKDRGRAADTIRRRGLSDSWDRIRVKYYERTPIDLEQRRDLEVHFEVSAFFGVEFRNVPEFHTAVKESKGHALTLVAFLTLGARAKAPEMAAAEREQDAWDMYKGFNLDEDEFPYTSFFFEQSTDVDVDGRDDTFAPSELPFINAPSEKQYGHLIPVLWRLYLAIGMRYGPMSLYGSSIMHENQPLGLSEQDCAAIGFRSKFQLKLPKEPSARELMVAAKRLSEELFGFEFTLREVEGGYLHLALKELTPKSKACKHNTVIDLACALLRKKGHASSGYWLAVMDSFAILTGSTHTPYMSVYPVGSERGTGYESGYWLPLGTRKGTMISYIPGGARRPSPFGCDGPLYAIVKAPCIYEYVSLALGKCLVELEKMRKKEEDTGQREDTSRADALEESLRNTLSESWLHIGAAQTQLTVEKHLCNGSHHGHRDGSLFFTGGIAFKIAGRYKWLDDVEDPLITIRIDRNRLRDKFTAVAYSGDVALARMPATASQSINFRPRQYSDGNAAVFPEPTPGYDGEPLVRDEFIGEEDFSWQEKLRDIDDAREAEAARNHREEYQQAYRESPSDMEHVCAFCAVRRKMNTRVDGGFVCSDYCRQELGRAFNFYYSGMCTRPAPRYSNDNALNDKCDELADHPWTEPARDDTRFKTAELFATLKNDDTYLYRIPKAFRRRILRKRARAEYSADDASDSTEGSEDDQPYPKHPRRDPGGPAEESLDKPVSRDSRLETSLDRHDFPSGASAVSEDEYRGRESEEDEGSGHESWTEDEQVGDLWDLDWLGN